MLGAFKESLGFQGIYFAVGLGAIGCAALYYCSMLAAAMHARLLLKVR